MFRMIAILATLILLPTFALAQAPAKKADVEDTDEKVLSGMSIVGNDEAPKSLVIVPWKSSELADGLDVSRALDEGRDPVDPDVFSRELTYFEIRVGQ